MRYLRYRQIVEREIRKFEEMLKKDSEIDRTAVELLLNVYYNRHI